MDGNVDLHLAGTVSVLVILLDELYRRKLQWSSSGIITRTDNNWLMLSMQLLEGHRELPGVLPATVSQRLDSGQHLFGRRLCLKLFWFSEVEA